MISDSPAIPAATPEPAAATPPVDPPAAAASVPPTPVPAPAAPPVIPQAAPTAPATPAVTTAPAPADSQLRQVLDDTLTAMERLMKLFQWERLLHLVVGLVAFLMLIAAGIVFFVDKGIDSTGLLLMFGSSGLITISSARITFFFNKGFVLVNDIVRAILATTAKRGEG